jgi:hypothetical protein
VQVDPLKPELKWSGTKRLTLKCDVLLSNYAVKFNLRHYTMVFNVVPTALEIALVSYILGTR